MSPFITFQDDGRFYVLHTAMPFYYGEVVRDREPGGLHVCRVTGYNIWITFVGSLNGNMVLMDAGWKDRIMDTVVLMADFYLRERVVPKAEKFRKWSMASEYL